MHRVPQDKRPIDSGEACEVIRSERDDRDDFFYERSAMGEVSTLPGGDGSTLEITAPAPDHPVGLGAAPRDDVDARNN